MTQDQNNSGGEAEDALAAANKEVALYRRLYSAQPEDFARKLAYKLIKLGDRLSALKRHDKSLRVTQDAVDIFRILSADRPKAFTDMLAFSLGNLGCDLSALGRHDESFNATQESVDLYRSLYADQPYTFAADLARSLVNLGCSLSGIGNSSEALRATQEAMELRRNAHDEKSDAFVADLANGLPNLSFNFSDLGWCDEALGPPPDAEELHRSLHAAESEAFVVDLAVNQNNLGYMLSELGSHDEALKAYQKAVEFYRTSYVDQPKVFAVKLAMSLNNMGCIFSNLNRHEDALNVTQEAVTLYRDLYATEQEAFVGDLASGLFTLGYCLRRLRGNEEFKPVLHEAGLLMVSQRTLDPHKWCRFLTQIVLDLDSAESLRSIHLAVLKRIADLRRLSYFDSAAGGEFIKLQAAVVADLWKKVSAASAQDPGLLDDTLAALVSAMQSPDLMRWLAENQRDTPEGKALAQAEDEMRQAQDALTSLFKRLRDDPGDQDFSNGTTRQAPTAGQQAALASQLETAKERETASRESLQKAQEDLADKDPAFASAYEIPPVSELRVMLEHLRVAATPEGASQAAPAALLCFLELPASGEQAGRLVGVLLSSGAAQVKQVEFPGLLELAKEFQHYKPGASAALDFDALLAELEQRWWAPLHQALSSELLQLGMLHVCSHGLAHQLPYSQVSYLRLGGNLQLFQWPGLPFLRLAYRQGNTTRETASNNSPRAGWQIGHDCAWTGSTPLPMVAVEAHLLLGIIRDAAGQQAEAVDDPAQVATSNRGLVICSHGTKAQGVNSAVHLPKGKMTTGEVMRRKIGPEIALIPACHAADTAEDHAHNALGVAAGFLLAGSKVVVGSSKAVPDTLMPWFSTLLVFYITHEKLGLHAAAVRARQDFGNSAFSPVFEALVRKHLVAGLATLHPGGQEAQRLNATLPVADLITTIAAWPWYGMNRDALVPENPVNLAKMQAASGQLASQALTKSNNKSKRGRVAAQMREMAAFLVVFGLG